MADETGWKWVKTPYGPVEVAVNPTRHEATRMARKSRFQAIKMARSQDANGQRTHFAWDGDFLHEAVAPNLGHVMHDGLDAELKNGRLEHIPYDEGNQSKQDLNDWFRIPKADGGGVGSGPVDDLANQDQPQRQLSPVGLYSHAADVVQKFPQMRGTPQQFKAMLTKQGVKPDEFKYSNYDQAFAGRPMVTKDELAQHFNASVPPVQETTLNKPERGGVREGETKFSQYTLPGGTNYRETLLHLPPRKAGPGEKSLADEVAPEHLRHLIVPPNTAADAQLYRASHWDTPNVLAHLRMSDRALPGGQKALHLEELQSDWAQEGRKKGFGDPAKQAELAKAVEDARRHTETVRTMLRKKMADTPEIDAVLGPAQEQYNNAVAAMHKNAAGVPGAPYIDSTQKWVDLGLKRLLHEAAKGGYHKVVMTPGEEQAKRYDLSKHIKNIVYNRANTNSKSGALQAFGHNGVPVVNQRASVDELPNIIGKEAAEKLMAKHAKSTIDDTIVHQLRDQDLKVGGEGMKAFYDQMLPKALEKLAKKHDPEAKVGKMKLVSRTKHPTNDMLERETKGPEVHSLDITPRMRESILKGQPAYAGGGKVEAEPEPKPESKTEPKADFRDLKRIGETWGYNSPHFIKAYAPYASGGDVEEPASPVNLASMFQSGHPAGAPAAAKPVPLRGAPTVPGSVSVKTLTDAFDTAVAHHRSLGLAERAANSRQAAETLTAHMGRTKSGMPPPLLTKNMKLMKSEAGYKGGAPIQLPDGRGVETTGLALAPAYQEGKFTTCPNSASCKSECLGKFSGGYFFAGGGEDPNVLKGPRLNSVRKTAAMLREPEAFAVRLHDEIEAAKRQAAMNNNMLGVRLNVLSDINPRVHKAIIEAHPDVAFYDYTKNNTNPIAPNHHYTYSSTGVSDEDVHNPHSNWKQMRKRLDTGSNVAMAFSHKAQLPEMVHDEESGRRYRVVNGDTHDFRPLDMQSEGQPGVIVGLKNKKISSTNEGAHRTSHGFFVRYQPDLMKDAQGRLARGPDKQLMPRNTEVRIRSQHAPPDLRTNDEADKP